MESELNTLYDLITLFFYNVRLGQDNREPNLTIIELREMLFLEKDSIIIFLILHGGLGDCVNARFEYFGFDDSPLKMEM